MHEMKVDSLGIFVGTGECNARCSHCAGQIHRKYAPKEDGEVNEELIRKTLEDCYVLGARKFSITSSGEPTLSPKSVTRVLEISEELKKEKEISYSRINLYSNGIRIGEDPEFCKTFLKSWEQLGLKRVYVTVHNANERKNSEIYGVESYPPLKTVVQRIHDSDLLMRANLVLSKRTISSLELFASTVSALRTIGADYISAWPIRGDDDQIDLTLAPSPEELERINSWVKANQQQNCPVTLCPVTFLGEDTREAYQSGRKLTLFPDGTLSNTWCNNPQEGRPCP